MRKKPTPEEVYAAADHAPALVNEALSEDGSAMNFIMGMTSRYGLHTDMAGAIAQMIRDLLLGLLTPIDFYAEMQLTGLDATTATRLAEDLNKEIFVPLRAQVQSSTSSVSNPVDPTAVPVLNPDSIKETAPIVARQSAFVSPPSPVVSTPIAPIAPVPVFVPPAPRPVPSIPTVPVSAPIAAPAPTPQPVVAPAPMSAPVVPTFIPAPAAALPTSMPAPMPRTMMGDMKEAKEHPDRIHAPEPIAPYVPAARPPVQTAVPQSAPIIQTTSSPQPTPTPKSENKEALHELLKSYGVDPYREPAE